MPILNKRLSLIFFAILIAVLVSCSKSNINQQNKNVTDSTGVKPDTLPANVSTTFGSAPGSWVIGMKTNQAAVNNMLPNTVSSVVNDSQGNVYILFDFYGQADVDPGTGVDLKGISIIGAYPAQPILAKYSVDGKLLWSKQFIVQGGSSTASANSYKLFVDKSDNLYCLLNCGGGTNLKYGSDSYAIKAGSSFNAGMIMKFNGDGSTSWIREISTSVFNANARVSDIAQDTKGNIYVTGVYLNTATFYSDQDTTINSPDPNDITYGHYYWAEYDATGRLLQVKSFLKDFFDSILSARLNTFITVDPNQNVFLCGETFGLEGAPNAIGDSLNPYSYGKFITKFDKNSNWLWVKAYTGSSNNLYAAFSGIASDSQGSAYVFGNELLDAYNTSDILWKVDANGNDIWNQLIYVDLTVGLNTSKTSISIDNKDRLLVAGDYQPTASNAPNFFSDYAIFINMYNVNGSLTYTKKLNGYPNTLAYISFYNSSIDNTGNLNVMGFYNGSFDLFGTVGDPPVNNITNTVFIAHFPVN